MKNLKRLLGVGAVLGAFMLAFIVLPVSVGAESVLDGVCDKTDSDSRVCGDEARKQDGGAILGIIVNTLLFIIGSISVIMIVIGGIMYATSAGDSGTVTKAKNTILYAIIGLALAFFAYAIVNWILQVF